MKLKPLFLGLALGTAFLSHGAMADKLSVAATPVPHAEILEFIKNTLKDDGVELDIKVFTDYVQPNAQVEDKNLDANFFQHQPYLDSFNEDRGTHLVSVGAVHIEPFGAYSKKVENTAELKEGATIAIPNDPSNAGRALLLLQEEGLIKLKDSSNLLSTARDIEDNPKKFKFKELEAATLARVLQDVDLALINTNYALEAGLNPTEDALFIEGAESPYANLVATHEDNKDNEDIKKLVKALQTDEVKEFIEEKYKGAIVPAF